MPVFSENRQKSSEKIILREIDGVGHQEGHLATQHPGRDDGGSWYIRDVINRKKNIFMIKHGYYLYVIIFDQTRLSK